MMRFLGKSSTFAAILPAWLCLCAPVALATDAPEVSASIARLRAAQDLLTAGDLAAAKAAYAVIADDKDVPGHHRREAEERIVEIERLQAGIAARDAKASRMPAPARPAPAVTLYVATDGADANPGTRERPFATLQRARQAIRDLKGGGVLPAGGVVVSVGGGSYPVKETFKLGPGDSGTENAPIVYRASPSEPARLTGGVRLTGFEPVVDPAVLARLPEEARGKVVSVDVKAHGVSELKPLELGGFASGRGFVTHPTVELFFNGEAMTLARWPNRGYTHIVDVSARDGEPLHGRTGSKTGRFRYEGDRPARWKDDRDAMLYGYWFFGWADSYEPIASIDTEKREITLKPPYANYGYDKGQPYYAVNLLSEIDVPGEWYLDRATGILCFYPPSDPGAATIELSTIDFPMVEMDGVSHVAFEGLCWELGGADGIHLRGGDHCLLAGCTIRRLAGNGVEIHGGHDHGLLSCDVHSMGRGGAAVFGGDRKTLTPGRHFVENCHIHDLSRIDHTYTPAVLLGGVGNRISHNLMHDVRSSAIRLGGNDHVVEFNEVHHVVWESDDQGGVDMFGDPTFRGNVLRFNYWHDVGGETGDGETPACGRAGVRLDDAISGVVVYGNVFQRCSAGRLGFGAVQIHGGKDNHVDNNVFVDCMAAVSFSPWGDARWRQFTAGSLASAEVDKDLYVARYPELARLAEDHDVNTISRSLVFRCGEFLRRDGGFARLAENVVTSDDPGFADAAGGDFRLARPSADAARIGFRPIPTDEIGLYEDAYRAKIDPRGTRAGE